MNIFLHPESLLSSSVNKHAVTSQITQNNPSQLKSALCYYAVVLYTGLLLSSDSPQVGEQQGQRQGDHHLERFPVDTQRSQERKNRLTPNAKQDGHHGHLEAVRKVAQLDSCGRSSGRNATQTSGLGLDITKAICYVQLLNLLN